MAAISATPAIREMKATPEPLPDNLMAALKEHKTEVLVVPEGGESLPIDPEVLRRAAMFREHLSKLGTKGWFVMPGATMQEGCCLTCGEGEPVGRYGVRCLTCNTAARLAISEQSFGRPR